MPFVQKSSIPEKSIIAFARRFGRVFVAGRVSAYASLFWASAPKGDAVLQNTVQVPVEAGLGRGYLRMDGQMDGWSGIHTDSPCVLKDFVFL